MFLRAFNGRFSGLVLCTVSFFGCSLLHASGTQSSSGNAEVAVEYRSNGLQEFRLADYHQELLQCSALSAIHMWIPDNIGEDSGSEVRKQLGEDYWLDLSKDYLALAKQASGQDDLMNEVGAEMKGLAGKWRRLTESGASGADWAEWYDLTDRCEKWRRGPTARSFYSKGRDSTIAPHTSSEVTRSPVS